MTKILPDKDVQDIFEQAAKHFAVALGVSQRQTWPVDQAREIVNRTEIIRIELATQITKLIENKHPVFCTKSLTLEGSPFKIIPDGQGPTSDYLNFWKWFVRWAKCQFPEIPGFINDAESIEFSQDNAKDAVTALCQQTKDWITVCKVITEAFSSDSRNKPIKAKRSKRLKASEKELLVGEYILENPNVTLRDIEKLSGLSRSTIGRTKIWKARMVVVQSKGLKKVPLSVMRTDDTRNRDETTRDLAEAVGSGYLEDD